MRFEVFGRARCARCKSTMAKLEHLVKKAGLNGAVRITSVDMDSIEGMAEGAFHDVQRVPTTILWSDGGDPLARWDGRIPPSAPIQGFLAEASRASVP